MKKSKEEFYYHFQDDEDLLLNDKETGGLDAKKNPTLQTAYILVTPQLEVLSSFSSYIYPPNDLYIDPKALAANKIDMSKVWAADPEEVVARRIKAWMDKVLRRKTVFGGWNAPFDWRFEKALQERVNIEFPFWQPEPDDEDGGFIVPPWFDAMRYVKSIDPGISQNKWGTNKHAKLEEACAYYGHVLKCAHNANFDIIGTLKCIKSARSQ